MLIVGIFMSIEKKNVRQIRYMSKMAAAVERLEIAIKRVGLCEEIRSHVLDFAIFPMIRQYIAKGIANHRLCSLGKTIG